VSWTRSIRASLSSGHRYQHALRMLRKMAEQRPAATALAFELLERVEDLECNRDTLLDSYIGLIPQKLQELETEDRGYTACSV
jgi:hypothetical protein